jgi:hypothetical protein
MITFTILLTLSLIGVIGALAIAGISWIAFVLPYVDVLACVLLIALIVKLFSRKKN